MRKRVIGIVVLLCMLAILGLGSYFYRKAGEEAAFSIRFLDVGQGDAALVECDGHYMLIDGGDIEAGDKVYETLKEQGVRKLDILVISHLHLDHMGGLAKALTQTSSVGVTLSNADHADREVFRQLERQLEESGCLWSNKPGQSRNCPYFYRKRFYFPINPLHFSACLMGNLTPTSSSHSSKMCTNLIHAS